MTAEIIKLPYSVTRAAHSRKPRRSKNGTPEERAAKLSPRAIVRDISRNGGDVPAPNAGASIAEFMQALRTYFTQEFARGRNVDQIFGDLEDSYRRRDQRPRKPTS